MGLTQDLPEPARDLKPPGGAMTDADARGDTELHRAVYSDDDRKVAELCRSAGAGLDQPNLNGDTPLICAVQMHSSRCVEVLLKAHASVASRNCAGYSPLLIAASEGRTELVALLAQSVVRTDVALLDATVGGSVSAVAPSRSRAPALPRATRQSPLHDCTTCARAQVYAPTLGFYQRGVRRCPCAVDGRCFMRRALAS